jgi:uncharacterized membrane protein YdjX (TVP38/TMEM64 family)
MTALNRLFKIVSFIFIVIIAMVIFTSDISKLIINGDIEGLQDYVDGNIWQMLLFTFLVMLFQNFITVIPLILLVTINITLFGFVYGYLWSLASSVAAGSIVFLLTRYWLQNWLVSKVKLSILQRIEKYGFLYVLGCRIIPIMPSNLINMTAGASTIRYGHFFLATLIGNLLFLGAVAGVTFGFMKAGWETAVLLAVLTAVCGIVLIIRRSRAKRSSGSTLT